jgi:cell division septal protein FtsQ
MTGQQLRPRVRRGPVQGARAEAAPARRYLWAVGQLVLLGGEIFLLLFLLAQPALRPKEVRVDGIRHLSAAQVMASLDLPQEESIFLVNRSALEQNLHALVWLQSAQVALSLPDRVLVRVHEWQPAAVLQQGEQAWYLSPEGNLLAPADEAGSLPIIERPLLQSARPGQTAIDQDLLAMLLPLFRGFPTAFHLRILSLKLDASEVLSLRTERGFQIIFGQMATAEQRATLEPKVGALKALSLRVDFSRAPIAYINLENPRAPAVLFKR